MFKRFAILLLLAVPARAADVPVVVELFTSQGCSSCPAADRVLERLAERADVLPLAFHVTYWNYIGWKDTFASEATTARQYAYARALGRPGVYTPQAVIGGATHVVGSDTAAVARAVASVRADAGRVPVAFDGSRVAVAGGPAPAEGASLWLACYDDRHEVQVGRGENGGRTLRYSNVVRHLERLAEWRGAALSATAPLEAQRLAGRDGCAAILQQAQAGPVLGAAHARLTARPAAR